MKFYLLKDFAHWKPCELQVALSEFYKFITLGLYQMNDLFVPVNKDIDKLWHCYVLQTREYRELCNKICPGEFLDHESISFKQYSLNMSQGEILAEDFYWMGLYYERFGDFTEPAIKYWTIPNYLFFKKKWTLNKINNMAKLVVGNAKTSI